MFKKNLQIGRAAGVPPQAIRAQCGCIRYFPALLGNAPFPKHVPHQASLPEGGGRAIARSEGVTPPPLRGAPSRRGPFRADTIRPKPADTRPLPCGRLITAPTDSFETSSKSAPLPKPPSPRVLQSAANPKYLCLPGASIPQQTGGRAIARSEGVTPPPLRFSRLRAARSRL